MPVHADVKDLLETMEEVLKEEELSRDAMDEEAREAQEQCWHSAGPGRRSTRWFFPAIWREAQSTRPMCTPLPMN